MEAKKISSSWTKPMLILMTLFWVVGLPALLVFMGGGLPSEGGLIFAWILSFALIFLTIYLAFSLSEVRVSDNEIRFKKIFGAEKTYSLNKIEYPSSFRFNRLKFTSVKTKGESGKFEKYLILNNDAILSGERIDAEEILLAVRREQRSKFK